MSRRKEAIVVRQYAPDPEMCERALKLLLNKDRSPAADPSERGKDAKEIENVRARRSIPD
jgi:hypothetical protein